MNPQSNQHPAQFGSAEVLDEACSAANPPPMGSTLSTDALLGGRNAVTIEHQGVHYVLRTTRSGKLILTK